MQKFIIARAAEQQSSRAAEQQSSRAAEQQSSRAAEQHKKDLFFDFLINKRALVTANNQNWLFAVTSALLHFYFVVGRNKLCQQ